MEPVHLTRIDEHANMRRFYRLSVQPGLFGDWSLIREWGRIGTGGQSMTEFFDFEGAAAAAGAKLCRLKRRRGYHDTMRAVHSINR